MNLGMETHVIGREFVQSLEAQNEAENNKILNDVSKSSPEDLIYKLLELRVSKK